MDWGGQTNEHHQPSVGFNVQGATTHWVGQMDGHTQESRFKINAQGPDGLEWMERWTPPTTSR